MVKIRLKMPISENRWLHFPKTWSPGKEKGAIGARKMPGFDQPNEGDPTQGNDAGSSQVPD